MPQVLIPTEPSLQPQGYFFFFFFNAFGFQLDESQMYGSHRYGGSVVIRGSHALLPNLELLLVHKALQGEKTISSLYQCFLPSQVGVTQRFEASKLSCLSCAVAGYTESLQVRDCQPIGESSARHIPSPSAHQGL